MLTESNSFLFPLRSLVCPTDRVRVRSSSTDFASHAVKAGGIIPEHYLVGCIGKNSLCHLTESVVSCDVLAFPFASRHANYLNSSLQE